MGYADGGGDTVNVWRAVSHMEAILQALTYPEIGKIVSTAADFNPDPAVPANDIRFLIQRGVDFIVGYPDAGMAIADAIKEAEDAGIPYVSFSAGWVGLPGQEGALVPGEDYLTVVGEDLCALGQELRAGPERRRRHRQGRRSSAERRATPCPSAGSNAPSPGFRTGSIWSIHRPTRTARPVTPVGIRRRSPASSRGC